MKLQCSTCLERMCPEEDLGCTPCGHVFHMACVLQWFENKKNCPQVILTDSEYILTFQIPFLVPDGSKEWSATKDILDRHRGRW